MIEHKYLIFFVTSIVCVPLGTLAAMYSRKIHDFVFLALVIGTTQTGSLMGLPTDINFYSREWYRGTSRGIEISYLDLLAVVLLLSSIAVRRKEGRPLFWPPSLLPLLAFFAWSVLNVAFFSSPQLYGTFEITKFARGILLFIATAAYTRSTRELRIFVYGLILAIFYEAAICLRDRYLFGMHRIQGTMPHPNSLSMYALQCIPFFQVIFLSTTATARQRLAAGFAFVAAAGCVLLTISRTGFAALILLSIAGFLAGNSTRLTARNLGFSLLGGILLAVMLFKSFDTTMSRLSGFDLKREYFTDEGDRGSYFRQATPAIKEHPIHGVGLNNWSFWITNRYAILTGYDTMFDRPITPYPNVDDLPESRRQFPPAHNLYLLTVTELGWPGLVLLLFIFGRWLMLTGSVFLHNRNTFADTIRVGAFLSLFAILLQSWTEWEVRQTPLFFLCHITMAIAATIHYHSRARQS